MNWSRPCEPSRLILHLPPNAATMAMPRGWRVGNAFTAYMREDDEQVGHVIRPDDLT